MRCQSFGRFCHSAAKIHTSETALSNSWSTLPLPKDIPQNNVQRISRDLEATEADGLKHMQLSDARSQFPFARRLLQPSRVAEGIHAGGWIGTSHSYQPVLICGRQR